MRKFVGAIIGLLGCALAASALASDAPTLPLLACGYQQIASFSTVQSLTVPTSCKSLSGAPNTAMIRVETEAVRFRDDGTAPTASVGMPLTTTDAPFYYSGNLDALQFIPESSSATLDVLYYIGPH